MRRALAVLTMAAAILAATSTVSLADLPHQDAKVLQAAGGGINSDNGVVNWYVPPYASSFGDLKIRYTQVTMADFPLLSSNSVWAAQPFSLEIRVYDTGALITLDKPSTLTVHYNPSGLGGRSESTLRVVMRATNAATWVDLPSTVDTTNHVVVAQVTDSGDYGLFASNAPAAGAPTPVAPVSPAPAPAPAPARDPTVATPSRVWGMATTL